MPPDDWNDVARELTDEELQRLVDEQPVWEPESLPPMRNGTDPDASPLADLADIGVGAMLDDAPLPRRWLLRDRLPLGVVGVLAAAGGTGKSILVLQLAVAVATGRSFLSIEVAEPGGVLIVAAEDDRDEVHRRLRRIVERLRADGEFSDYEDRLLRERLFIAPRVGEDNRLTAHDPERGLVRTEIGTRIAATAQAIPSLRLIVLDPVSRFRGGEENSNDDATTFVVAVERLRAETDATILLPHHVSKDGIRAGAERLAVESLRGASALIDGVRWAAAMATLRRDAAEEYGLDPDDAGRFVRLDIVKSNYAAPWAGMWLERANGGVLVPCELRRTRREKDAARAEDRYRETLPKLVALVRKEQEAGQPLTRNRIRSFAGKSGYFGVSDTTLRSIVERAIQEGQIREHETTEKHHGRELRTW